MGKVYPRERDRNAMLLRSLDDLSLSKPLPPELKVRMFSWAVAGFWARDHVVNKFVLTAKGREAAR